VAKIFYGVAGEGRGHATRVRTIVDALRADHRIEIFAPGDAYDLLAPAYADSSVRVRRIPGLRFAYNRSGAVSKWRTALGGARYALRLAALLEPLEAAIDDGRPDLVITDFEPSLARAALRRGVPLISLDHQHFLRVSDFSSLPIGLQARAAVLGAVVDLYYSGQRSTIVSSFCFPGLRPGVRDTLEVGPLLRRQILETVPIHGEHLTVYLRRAASQRFLDALAASGREARIYGLGAHESRGNLRFLAIDERRFLEDLAGSFALVTTAGNQLLGEALYLRKPILALPEPQNAEQLLHGHLLAREGTGEWARFETIDAEAVRAFLSRVELYRSRIVTEGLAGNAAALAEVRRFLPLTAPPPRAPVPVS
jgi:uncharacterized protein (TIGR00661 family)